MKLLILNGADYNAVDEQCRTSLYIAAQKGYEACVHAHLDSAIWKDILSIPIKATGEFNTRLIFYSIVLVRQGCHGQGKISGK